MLLYDLTSTHLEIDPPSSGSDQRPDGDQVVIELIVTPEGFPLAYEVLPVHTAAPTTLKDFLARIECPYGQVRRIGGRGPRHSDRGDAHP